MRRTARLEFPNPAALAGDADHSARLRLYVTDMLRPYGLEFDEAAFVRGGQSYGEMAEALIALAVPEGESVDLLVLAHVVPDISPGRATTTYLSHVCPGGPMAFAINDQGAAAAFTAMRLIREYARTDGLRRALLLVLEQATLPYATGGAPMPGGNSGVALLFGDGDGVSEFDRVSVRPGTALSALPTKINPLISNHNDTTLIVGASLTNQTSDLHGADVRIAAADQPHVGAWWELAGALADAKTSHLTLADYDDESRSLCLATFSVDGPGGSGRA
ncbi:MAG TPA: hypothetical protein VFU73_07250 [Actinocrinis sp.]|nr:hypothetical protein [Actinocrinis sp.]